MTRSRDELLQSLIQKMASVMRGMHAGQGFRFAGVAIGAPQVSILFRVSHKPEGVSVKELADAMSVTPGAVTQFIDALVDKGLVKREEDAADRRVVRITLTQFAMTNFQSFRQDYFATVRRAFDSLTDKEIAQLIDLLMKTSPLCAAAKETGK
jgi:DNA-binding MarR family transcriptional regulator